MYMKIAVLNNSGNVGKSTICQTLLKPRLENSEIIRVETINSDGTSDEKVSAREFDEILKRIDDAECTIIDVGSSNIEQFMVQMLEFKGSHELIDYFLIPVTTQDKQQRDSINTINNLLDSGIEMERIKIILNQAEKDLEIKKQYSIFMNNKQCKKITGDNPAIVYYNNIFNILTKSGLRYDDIYNDDRDFRSLIRSAESKETRQELSNLRTVKMLMNGFNSDLDIAFKNLDIA
ncbi:StbB family protein [Pantoea stewartii]|uniref:Transcriptional regulator n=2 Tax=Pantoea stewartii TaxID=66269 RepID=H3RM40_PANSE|nr:StbB family protein [Pantoea stewartii]ARF52103.1 transcriptional regulator [Pantoea stewartii subsp. stewartii DC283]EHT97548.1 putative transcriptional regulator [Pantoea stewartii subsp. stewartii DC283]KAB0547532.1 transcriptional regulator [Pantoea stewartii subsp. stewartii]